jgi:hypothetical protein
VNPASRSELATRSRMYSSSSTTRTVASRMPEA